MCKASLFGALLASVFYVCYIALRGFSNIRPETVVDRSDSLSANVDRVPKSLNNFLYETENQPCPMKQEHHHVVFLKVHKAGSTTMLNILARFALARELSVLMLNSSPDLSQFQTTIPKAHILPAPGNGKYDMVFHHIVFNKTDLAQFFPQDVVYIAIVRNPFDAFISMFKYLKVEWGHHIVLSAERANPKDPIREYLLNPKNYMEPKTIRNLLDNRQAIDFGADLSNFQALKNDPIKIGEFIDSIDKHFQLVMVVDYFDESLIMLKRLLGWSFKDILYMKLNKFRGKNPSKWTLVEEYPEDIRALHRQWSPIDYAIYDHFRRIFEKKLKEQTCDFESEVKIFREILEKVQKFCSNLTTATVIAVNKTRWSDYFEVTQSDCHLMKTEEVPMTRLLREKMLEKLKS